MERDVTIMPADADFGAFLREHAEASGFKHVVVTRGSYVVGIVRINTGLRRGAEAAYMPVRFGDIAQRNFTLARADDIMFDVVQRMTRRDATMAIVASGKRR